MKQVAHYLGAVEATERELRDALVVVAERHERNHELSHGACNIPTPPWDCQVASSGPSLATMDDERPTQAELLDAWRDAARAAQLTGRLIAVANKAADDAEQDALASEEIADLAEGVSRDAGLAANKARQMAMKARLLATERRRDSDSTSKPTTPQPPQRPDQPAKPPEAQRSSSAPGTAPAGDRAR